MDVTQFSMMVMKNVREFVQPALDALAKRADDGVAALRNEIEQRIEAIPQGKDGEPGKDGVNGGDGAPGEPGVPGSDGKDGADGKDGTDAPPVTDDQIAKAVAAHLAANPIPAGRDGRDGLPGSPGTPGEKGADGMHGKDGANGVDGFSLDDFECELVEERTIELRFVRGDSVITKRLTIPYPVDRGVYRAATEYAKGDCVTFGGSLWMAQRDTAVKPQSEGDDSWRLAVKCGRDGRDGERGKDFTPPAPVRLA